MNASLGSLDPAGPVQNLSWVRKVLIWHKEQGHGQYLGFCSIQFRCQFPLGTEKRVLTGFVENGEAGPRGFRL